MFESVTWLSMLDIFEQVGVWVASVFNFQWEFYSALGVAGVILFMLFCVGVFRYIIYPIIGGASIQLGQDQAKPDRRIHSVIYTRNEDGSRTGTYKYRDEE